MSPRKAQGKDPARRFTVSGVRREAPDIRKLAKALLAVATSEHQRAEEDDAPEERGAE
jgi:hypothetical protein